MPSKTKKTWERCARPGWSAVSAAALRAGWSSSHQPRMSRALRSAEVPVHPTSSRSAEVPVCPSIRRRRSWGLQFGWLLSQFWANAGLEQICRFVKKKNTWRSVYTKNTRARCPYSAADLWLFWTSLLPFLTRIYGTLSDVEVYRT